MAKDNTSQILKQEIKIIQITMKETLKLLRKIIAEMQERRMFHGLERNDQRLYAIQKNPDNYVTFQCKDNDNVDLLRGICRDHGFDPYVIDERASGTGGLFVVNRRYERAFQEAVEEYNKELRECNSYEEVEALRGRYGASTYRNESHTHRNEREFKEDIEEYEEELRQNESKSSRNRNNEQVKDDETKEPDANTRESSEGYKKYKCTDNDRVDDLKKICREENIEFTFKPSGKDPGGTFIIKKEDEEKFLTAVAGYEKKRKEAENSKKDTADKEEYDDEEIIPSNAEKKGKKKESEKKENESKSSENGQENSLDDLEDESKDSDELGDDNTSSDERGDNGSERDEAVENGSEEQEYSSEDAEKAESRMKAEEKAEEAREQLRDDIENPEDTNDNSWMDQEQDENTSDIDEHSEDQESYEEDNSVDETVEEQEQSEADFVENPEDTNDNSWLDENQEEASDSNEYDTENDYSEEESYNEDSSVEDTSIEDSQQQEADFVENPENVNNDSWLNENQDTNSEQYNEENNYSEQESFTEENPVTNPEQVNEPEQQTADFAQNPEDVNNNSWLNENQDQSQQNFDNSSDRNTNNFVNDQQLAGTSSEFTNIQNDTAVNNINNNFADQSVVNNANQEINNNQNSANTFNQTNANESAAGTSTTFTNTENSASEQQLSLYQNNANSNQEFQNTPDTSSINTNNINANNFENSFTNNPVNQTSQPANQNIENTFNNHNDINRANNVNTDFNAGAGTVGNVDQNRGSTFENNTGITGQQSPSNINNGFNANEQFHGVGTQPGNTDFSNQNNSSVGINNANSAIGGQQQNVDTGNHVNNNDQVGISTPTIGVSNNNIPGSEAFANNHSVGIAQNNNQVSAITPQIQNDIGSGAGLQAINTGIKTTTSENRGITFANSFGGTNELEITSAETPFIENADASVVDHKAFAQAGIDTAKIAADGGDKNFVKKGFKEFKKSGAGDMINMGTYSLTGALSHGVSPGNINNQTMRSLERTLGREDTALLIKVLGVEGESTEKQLDKITSFMEKGHLIHRNKISGKHESKGTNWEYNKPVTPIGKHEANKTARVVTNNRRARAHYTTSGELTSSNLRKAAASKGTHISKEKADELTKKLSKSGDVVANRKDMALIGKNAGKKFYKKMWAAADDPNNTTTQAVKKINNTIRTGSQVLDISRQGRAILANQFKGRAQRQITLNARRMNQTANAKVYNKARKKYEKYSKKYEKYSRKIDLLEKKRENARKGLAGRIKESKAYTTLKTKATNGLKKVGCKITAKVAPVRLAVRGVRAVGAALGFGQTAAAFASSGGNPLVFAAKKVVELLISMVTDITKFIEEAKRILIKILLFMSIQIMLLVANMMIISSVGMAICSVLTTYGTKFDINEADEPDTATDEEITNSTYGIVYEELRKEEISWFSNLVEQMQEKQYMSVADTSYTDTSTLGAKKGTISGEQSGINGQVTSSTPPTNLGVIKNAGQEAISATDAEVLFLAQVIYNEASGESYETQVGVAEVIINRVKSSSTDFPGTTITKILTQDGQFSDLARARTFSMAQVASQMLIAKGVINGNLRIFNNPEILFFNNSKKTTGVEAGERKDWEHNGTWYAGLSDTAFYYADNNATNKDYGFVGEMTATTTIKNAEDYASQNLGTSYQDGGFKGPTPFEGAPEEAYKNITIIDGEQAVIYRDANGNYGCKSNLRQILSMAMVAQQQNDNFDEDIDEDALELITSDSLVDKIKGIFSVALKAISALIDTIKDAFTSAVEKIFPSFKQWWEHHEAKKRAKIVMAYCKPLFDLSHQNEFTESMSIHPTLRTLKNSGISADEYDGEICNGNEAQTGEATDAHNGYGCMSYNKFFYTDNNDTDVSLSENGSLVMEVEPAGFHTGDEGVIPCSAPDGNMDTFINRLDANSDCWEITVGDSYISSHGAKKYHISSSFIESAVGDYESFSGYGKGGTYNITLQLDHWSDDDDKEYELQDITITHHCSGNHTGYYCGGHLDNSIQSVITSWTKAQEESTRGQYFSKVSDTVTYKVAKDYAEPSTEDLKNAQDLFDIDMLITHIEGSVHQEKDSEGNTIYFEGWTLDNIDQAVAKWDDDWNKTYPGIKWEDDITVSADEISGGTATAGGQGSTQIKTALSTTQIHNALNLAMSQIPDDDPMKAERESAMYTALYYVGKVNYQKLNGGHKFRLIVGGTNDCSGYASCCWKQKLNKLHSTSSFKSDFQNSSAWHRFTDGGCKPGDILLRYPADGNNHALIYMGKDSDGYNISVDESSPCSQYRSRGEWYYNQCFYIDMSAL